MATEATTEDEEQEKERVAVGPNAWGRGRFAIDAVQEMVGNIPDRILRQNDTVTITLFTVRGFDRVDGVNGAVYADDMLSKEVVEVESREVEQLTDMLGRATRQAESLLVDGETIEEEDLSDEE